MFNRFEMFLIAVAAFMIFIGFASLPISLIFGFNREWITPRMSFDMLSMAVVLSGLSILACTGILYGARMFILHNSKENEIGPG